MAGHLDEVIIGLKSIKFDLERRAIFDEDAQRSDIIAAGFVVSMIDAHVEMLSQVGPERSDEINAAFMQIEDAMKAARHD